MNNTFFLKLTDASLAERFITTLNNAFERKLHDRGCIVKDDGYPITVTIDPSLQEGVYHLSREHDHAELRAADKCAVYAGLGEFLLGWKFEKDGSFEIPSACIDFTPVKPLRGLYFATHFHNFYHTAPIEKVLEQVEDVAFRGGNAIALWYDMHHYRSIDDPESLVMIQRLKAIMRHARLLGMKTCFTTLSNEAFMGTPDALKASSVPQNGYKAVLDGHYGVEICPSKQGGIEEIVRQRRIMLKAFADCQADYVTYWPYDQGGCTCKDCAPWGVNGMLRLFPAFRKVVNEEMPGTKIIMSTWYFDRFYPGEWELFHKKINAEPPEGVDFLMDFFPGGSIPECIAEKGLPAGLPMLSFPEISMVGGKPWGGFGANPYPGYLQESNNTALAFYSGELCYSEGIFEDINKTIMMLTYSGRETDTRRAVADYASWELMTDSPESIIKLTELLESALPRNEIKEETEIRYEIKNPGTVTEAAELARKINSEIPMPARENWRWRIIYLRALIDEQLVLAGGSINAICDRYLSELQEIYHIVPESLSCITPPTRDYIRKRCHIAESMWLSEAEKGE